MYSIPGTSGRPLRQQEPQPAVRQQEPQPAVRQQASFTGVDKAISQRVTALMNSIKKVAKREGKGSYRLTDAPRFLTAAVDTDPEVRKWYPGSCKLRRHWQEIVALVGQQRYPGVETLAAVKDKKRGWFEMVLTLHFAGYPTEQYSNAQLGLESSPGTLGQNRVFCAVFDQLRACAGARSEAGFIRFASWLAALDIAKEYPNPWVTSLVQPGVLSMRSEFCQSVPDSVGQGRAPFNPNFSSHYLSDRVKQMDRDDKLWPDAHTGFVDYYLRFQPTLLAIVLSVAPEDFRLKTLQAWLTGKDKEAIAARKSVFQQRYYPLNTFFRDYYPWNALVMPITGDLPPPPGAALLRDLPVVTEQTPVSLPTLSDLSKLAPNTIDSAFGRTLKGATTDGMVRFIKIQSAGESDRDFIRTYQRLEWLHGKRKALNLDSEVVVPEKLFRLARPAKLLNKTGLTLDEKMRIEQQIGQKARLAMVFHCPEQSPYDQYLYDVDDPAVAMEGLYTYASDYGRLWSCGLLGPAAINAYHDRSKNRRHTLLTTYIDCDNEGSMERWNGHATNYPNVGGKVGMRDQGDIRLPEEVDEGFDDEPREDFDPLVDDKIRLNELGRAAQGVVLLYARRFQKDFDHTKPTSVDRIVQDIGPLLAKLFAHASPLSEQQCLDYLQQDGLLAQCARELSYWTAKHVPYVEDVRAGVINTTVYPHLPKEMYGAVLCQTDREFLTDKGFHDPRRDRGDECQLGAGSGRNPLIALNALIVKMLCLVVVAMWFPIAVG